MISRSLWACARGVFLLGALGFASAAVAAEEEGQAVDPSVSLAFDEAIGTYLKEHCLRCHGAEKQKGDFRIDTLSKDVGGGGSVIHWAEVIEKINSGEMPPPEEEVLPTADEGAAVVDWLAERIKEGEAARLAKREPVSFHRLSREEYANTLYDLLGVQYDFADPGELTEDPMWHGFERIGSVLSLSASHMEKYFAAAETVLAEAFPVVDPKKPIEPVKIRKRGIDLRGGPSKEEIEKLESLGLADKVRVDLWPGHRLTRGPGRLPAAGVYRCRLQVSGLPTPGPDGRAPHLTVYAKKQDRMLFETDVVAPEDKPIVLEFETHLPEGSLQVEMMNDVPGPSVLPRSGRSGRQPFFGTKYGRIPWQLKLTDEKGQPLYPFLIVDWVEWEGPIITPEEKARRDRWMPKEEGNLTEARECLRRFAEKAFRRPVGEVELNRIMALVESEIEAGEDYFAAVKTGFLAVLCSKDFFYLVEGAPDKPVGELTAWELASRLSYFLWSTMPDDELLHLARKGTLSEPEVLRGQVRRMLDDPRASRFAESFPTQWLQLQKVGMFTPDSKLYPEYDKYLERSMVGETLAFFGEVLEQNLSLDQFLLSDWTMINPRLARHYEMVPLIKSEDTFQRVALKPEHRRGGILTHASVLSLTSDGTRHRPVHRGVWVMESIFGKSPPPPPANVDPIEPNPVDAPKATVRMKLEAHTKDPNCAGCHKKIDPLGFAFDHYDAIGRWREVEKVPKGQGADPKVDASGQLVDGRAYQDAREFQQLLLEERDTFAHTVVKKLATYAMRRTMSIDDREDLEAIAAESGEGEYRLRDTIEALVLSDLFKRR